MADPRPIVLAISYGKTDSVKNSGGELWNWYAEAAPEDAKTPVTLFGSPGAVLFSDIEPEGTPGDALDGVVVNDQLYVWTTTGLIKVYADGTYRRLGNATLTAPARCDTNGVDIVCVDGVKGYKYTITADEDVILAPVVTEITDPDFYPASTVTTIDSYFVFPKDGTGQFFSSELFSTDIGALDIRSSEGNPDKVVTLLARTQELWVLNSRSFEVFYNAGATLGSPFERIQGAFGDIGASSPWSIAKTDRAIFWHSHTGKVYMAQGFVPQEVSTNAVHEAFAGQDFTTADAFVWKYGTHEFYQLTIGTVTMVYDITTQLWHRAGTASTPHPALRGIYCYGKNLMWNRSGAEILRVHEGAYDWNGTAIEGKIICAPLHANQMNVAHGQLEIEPDTGQGLADPGDPPAPPTMRLRYSDDGGRTFKNPQTRSLGLAGETKRRVQWNRLGSARDRRYELFIDAPIKRSMLSRALLVVG